MSVDDEIGLLSQLSLGLREEVAIAVNEKYLEDMPFFAGEDPTVVMELAFCMERCYFAPEEDVITIGEIGAEMYFILEGRVEILVEITKPRHDSPPPVRSLKRQGSLGSNILSSAFEGIADMANLKGNKDESAVEEGTEEKGLGTEFKVVSELGKGKFFGEMALLYPNQARTATVRTLNFCELRSLSAEAFNVIAARYPTFGRSMMVPPSPPFPSSLPPSLNPPRIAEV